MEGGPVFKEKEAEEGLDDEDMLNDLMGLGPSKPTPALSGGGGDLIGDMMGMGNGGGGGALRLPEGLEILVSPEKAGGLGFRGKFLREPNGFMGPGLYFYLEAVNQGQLTAGQIDLMINKNSFGVAIRGVSYDGQSQQGSFSPLLTPSAPGMPMGPGGRTSLCIALDTTGPVMGMNPLMMLQFAMKIDQHPPVYFSATLPLHGVFKDSVECAKQQFMNMWKAVPGENEQVFMVSEGVGSPDEAIRKLGASNINHIHSREEGATTVLYCATQTTNNLWVLFEMPVNAGRAQCRVRLQNKVLAPFVESSLTAILQGKAQ